MIVEPGRPPGPTAAREATVSVIVPARDAAPYLAECLASVLRQSHPVHEVIVVDDGSTDATAAIAARFGAPVRVVGQAPAGANPARNRGVRESSGAFVAFLDADDLWEPTKLEVQVAAFAADPPPDLVFGMVTQFRSPELAAGEGPALRSGASPMVGHHLGAMLVRRETFEGVGWLDETTYSGDFVDWFARASDQRLRIVTVDEVVMRRRLHRHNKGLTEPAGPREYARALRKVLERRRAATG